MREMAGMSSLEREGGGGVTNIGKDNELYNMNMSTEQNVNGMPVINNTHLYTSNQPIRDRYLGHVTGNQPIRCQYLPLQPCPLDSWQRAY